MIVHKVAEGSVLSLKLMKILNSISLLLILWYFADDQSSGKVPSGLSAQQNSFQQSYECVHLALTSLTLK